MTTELKPTSLARPRNLPRNHKLVKKIGRRIRIIRDVRGISRFKLAELAQICPKDLRRYEAGVVAITVDDLATISDILKIGASHFFF